jgi:hypothetical protein
LAVKSRIEIVSGTWEGILPCAFYYASKTDENIAKIVAEKLA